MMDRNEIVVEEKVYVEDLSVSAYTIPTDKPESDGTLEWNGTTLVLVTVQAGGKTGIGYTYADSAVAHLIYHNLKKLVIGRNAMDIPAIIEQLIGKVRNNGTSGICMMAVSAIDTALWDLKAKLLQLPLASLLGCESDSILVYGSGGFTSYNKQELQEQIAGWKEYGISHVKIKIGREPAKDADRVKWARTAAGGDAEVFVDANAAYTVQQAVQQATLFEEYAISWFEEPVKVDNPEDLYFIRQKIPSGINIAAGEYGYTPVDFRRLLSAKAIDVLQADATRCGGVSGFLKAGCLAQAFNVPFSSHCAPALHLHAAMSLQGFYIAEYFHDHTRIENMLFDGVPVPVNGRLKPDLSRPGIGIEFKYKDAERYKV